MEKNQKCLLCGKDSVLKSTDKTGFQEPDVFYIWHCPHFYAYQVQKVFCTKLPPLFQDKLE
jgi:hypothetical protein